MRILQDSDYRPEDGVLNPYASQTDGYDSEYESIVDSVINYNINECDFSKISCAETEFDLEKPTNAEIAKRIKKNWESKKVNDNMKSIFEKYKSAENCVIVPPKVNLELWKLLSSWQRKSDIKFMSIHKSLVRTMNASRSIVKYTVVTSMCKVLLRKQQTLLPDWVKPNMNCL